MATRMVVGLGNPGRKYTSTRHNIGYRVIEALEEQPPVGAVLFKPEEVFMNESGGSVAAMARRKGIQPSELLVICDDFMIPLGTLRIRLKGTSGGHNGLDSILGAVGTQDVPRLRFGIGPVPEGVDPAYYVLKSFSAGERSTVNEMIDQAAEAVRVVLADGLEAAMNRFNKKGAVS